MSEFQTYKKDLSQSRLVETDKAQALADLKTGDILVEIERFAFTANNVTYGAAGDTIGYWKFFPVTDNEIADWGCLPVWGFAEISASKVEGLAVGERIYGYFPPADFLVMSPIKVSTQRFVDGVSHRAELPAVYNNYLLLSGEANYDASSDNVRALLNPLHVTSFCLCDALQSETYHGASQVLILSASSKTAIGVAQRLANDKNSPNIIAVTSRANHDFVASLGCYDEIICYHQLGDIDASKATVMVDMASNRAVLGAIHEALGDNMLSCISVGMTHWETLSDNDPLAAKINRQRSSFFFAPAHVQKRVGDWGQEGFSQQAGAFTRAREQQSKDWMTVETVPDFTAFAEVYADVVAGIMNPNEGLIVLPK
tara:strand:+ start:228 stop:1337 length:1110 start_codon:yes stop_codon:yes gene_type:complete